MPLGLDYVEPPLWFELQKLGVTIHDGQQTMHDAREIKSYDEIMLLSHLGGDGRRDVSGYRRGASSPA